MNPKIVVMLPNFIGDSIMSTPALQLLQELYPNTQITLLCRNAVTAELFSREAAYRVLVDPRSEDKRKGVFGLIRLLKRERFTLGFLFRNNFIDALCFKLGRVNKIVGYNKEGRGFLLDHSERLYEPRHYINHFAHLVNVTHGNEKRRLKKIKLTHTPRLPEALKNIAPPLVGVYFGGKNKTIRHFPHAHAVSVLTQINAENDVQFVLLGDSQESESTRELANLLKEKGLDPINMCGQTSIVALVDMIAAMDLVISIDSSPVHIAAAVGTPVVAIVGIGTSSWDRVAPKGNFGIAIRSSGQYLRDEDQVQDIEPACIAHAAAKLLAEQRLPNVANLRTPL